jgi:hypothetical protein
VVLRALTLAVALLPLAAPLARTAELPAEPVIPEALRSGAILQVDLSRTETVKLEAEKAVDSAVEALRQAKVPLTFRLGQDLTAHGNTLSQIETATAMELIQ